MKNLEQKKRFFKFHKNFRLFHVQITEKTAEKIQRQGPLEIFFMTRNFGACGRPPPPPPWLRHWVQCSKIPGQWQLSKHQKCACQHTCQCILFRTWARLYVMNFVTLSSARAVETRSSEFGQSHGNSFLHSVKIRCTRCGQICTFGKVSVVLGRRTARSLTVPYLNSSALKRKSDHTYVYTSSHRVNS